MNNVTVRNDTGKEKFFQGTQATKILAQLDSGGDPQIILAPLLEFLQSDVTDADSDFMAEIKAPAGTYNFPWEHENQHGLATAMYRTDLDHPVLKLESVRDAEGDEIENIENDMHRALMTQARDFIGRE